MARQPNVTADQALGRFGRGPGSERHGVGLALDRCAEFLGHQNRGAAGDHHPHDVPHRVAAAWVQAGGGLVEEQHVRRVEDAGADVDAPTHAARNTSSPVGRPRRLQQLGRPVAGLGLGISEEGASRTRFSVPVRASSTDAYRPVRLTRLRTASASLTTSWPKTRAEPPSGRSKVASMRTTVVFPAPFGPQ
jgi:hypothetical protein